MSLISRSNLIISSRLGSGICGVCYVQFGRGGLRVWLVRLSEVWIVFDEGGGVMIWGGWGGSFEVDRR